MNSLQKNTLGTPINLNSQLAEFGLQPSDWKLTPTSGKTIKIQNKNESSFYFMGSLQKINGKPIWKSIRLAGL